MRMFYEAWSSIENNSLDATDEIQNNSTIVIGELPEETDIKINTIRQLLATTTSYKA